MEPPLAARQDGHGDGPGVVPPDFTRHAAVELEGGHHAGQHCLGTLGGQRQGENSVGVAPGADEDRHQAAAAGQVHVEVPEVGLQPFRVPLLRRGLLIVGADPVDGRLHRLQNRRRAGRAERVALWLRLGEGLADGPA